MASLPYADLNDPETKPLVDRIIAERGSVLHLYQMLLHSPPVAEGWLTFLTAIRQKTSLAGDLRELVIMHVAELNGASYEAAQHAPIALKEGLRPAQLAALGDWRNSAEFDDRERATLELCESMTREVHVGPELIGTVRERLGNRETVELVATIAAYNMVSRFLEATHVHADDPQV